MKLKITSDGTNKGTRLIDENGENIIGVVGIKWEGHIKEGTTKAVIEFVDIPMESEIENEHVLCKRPTISYWLNSLRGRLLGSW